MKRIVLTTVGTTGDVVPLVALGRCLIERGHAVRFASHAVHRRLIEEAGIEFAPIGEPFPVEEINELMERAALLEKPLDQFELIAGEMFFHDAERALLDHLEAIQDASVVVANRFDYLGQEAAIDRGLPWISVTLSPNLIRTAEAPVYPAPRLGRWWTELTWNGLERMAAKQNARLSRALIQLGARPRKLGVAGVLSPHLNLVAASPHLVDVRTDWPENVVVTGAWFAPASDKTLDPELAKFLEQHADPIVISFGSMGGARKEETEELLAAALARVGRAAIVQAGYAGLAAESELVFTAPFVPHELFFSRAACVVHHGGAGTSASACRSGVPSVPVPHLFDQFYWAGMLHARGVAPRPLFRKDLNARRLASRIESALSRKMREKARVLGEKIRAERGVETAAEKIEALIRRPLRC